MGYQSAHHDQLDHARVRRDVQKTESERSEEFHIQPTLLLGLSLTTSISFNLFLIFYIYRKSLFVSLPQDIKVLAWTAQQESISQIFTTLVFHFITLFELFTQCYVYCCTMIKFYSNSYFCHFCIYKKNTNIFNKLPWWSKIISTNKQISITSLSLKNHVS